AESAKQIVSLLVIILLAITPVTAARPACAASLVSVAPPLQQDDPDQEGVTFDNLLAAGSYSFYVEARNIGQQAHSSEIATLIEPLKPMLDTMQNELTMLGDFIYTNADLLSRSRVMMAAQPARSSLPPVMIAIELASADSAEKLEQKVREFINAAMKSGISLPAGFRVFDTTSQSASEARAGRTLDQIIPIKRAGRVLAISFMPFTFKGLRPQSEKALSDDPKFRTARDRFSFETLFIYYDLSLSTRALQERIDSIEKAAPPAPKLAQPGTPLSLNEPELYIEPEPTVSEPPPSSSEDSALTDSEPSSLEYPAQYASAEFEPSYQQVAQAKSRSASSNKKATAPPAPSSQTQTPGKRAGEQPSSQQPSSQPPLLVPSQVTPGDPVQEAQRGTLNTLGKLVEAVMRGGFGGGSFPDAIAAGLALESDSLIVRLLMLNPSGTKMGPIPFLPLLVSGPAQASDAASYMPMDTDVFLTASLDFNQLYETILTNITAPTAPQSPGASKDEDSSGESGLAGLEKVIGFNIKEEILSTLGNEIAIGVPASYLSGTPLGVVPLKGQTPQAGPVFLISVRNKEALQAKLKPVLEAIGLKAPNEKGISEKYGDIEINSYSYGSVAFINNYLIVASTAAGVRRVLEARAKDQTLMTSRDFHSYMQWQPRETVAQLYISAAVLKDVFKKSQAAIDQYDAETKLFLARFDFDSEPITYAATSDFAGPLYELRIPKNLLAKAFASLSAEERMSRGPKNESAAEAYLNLLNSHEQKYKMINKRFGTLDEIQVFGSGEKGFRGYFDRIGYKLEFTL
ncbi:MAG TPA: hypothetical protein VF747_10600, partial [Blastocatellia bacterium]